MNDNRYNIISTIILLISPILALPFILFGIYNRQKYAFILFSFFLGLIAFLTIPFADLYRHTMHYYSYAGLSTLEIFNNADSDFLIPVITGLLVNNGVPYEFFRLFEAVVASSLLISIFQYHIKNGKMMYSRKQAFFRFCILILFFEFLVTIIGVRYGFATIIYIYGLHKYLDKKQYLFAFLLFLLASLVHVSMGFLIPISLILYKLPISKKIGLLVTIIIVIIAPSLFEILGFMLGKRADWYFSDGIYTTDGWSNASVIGLILVIGKRLFLLPVIYYIARGYVNDSWHKIGLVWLMFAISFMMNVNLFGRCLVILQHLLPIIILFTENQFPLKNKNIERIIYCGLFITLFSSINMFKGFIYPSRYERMILPVPMILNDTYEKDWILHHIDNNTYTRSVR